MQIQFLGQPFRAEDQIGPAIAGALAQDWSAYAWFATAWIRHSGLARIHDDLRDLRSQGGHLEAVVGIDGKGTTQEGLKLALEVFDDVYIYHDRGRRTYHPKLYVVEGDSEARVVVGSGNFSHDGLFTNYEADVSIALDKSELEDDKFLESVRDYYQALKASPACIPLDDSLIDTLNRRGWIVRESTSHASQSESTAGSAGDESDPIGASVSGLAGAPDKHLDFDRPDTESTDGEEGPLDTTTDRPGEATGTTGTEARPADTGFYKALSANDVSLDSSPGQIVIPIRFTAFFEPLEVQKDESSEGGVRQSHRILPVIFRDRVTDDFSTRVESTRAVLYEPAEEHPRPNDELRFTFRNRDVFERLSKDDVLTFERDEQGMIVVERHPAGSFPDRYDWL